MNETMEQRHLQRARDFVVEHTWIDSPREAQLAIAALCKEVEAEVAAAHVDALAKAIRERDEALAEVRRLQVALDEANLGRRNAESVCRDAVEECRRLRADLECATAFRVDSAFVLLNTYGTWDVSRYGRHATRPTRDEAIALARQWAGEDGVK